MKLDLQDRGFNLVKIKYINFDSKKSNIIQIFISLFPRATTEALHAPKYNVVFKTYINSSIEYLGVCLVKFRHKDKVARCIFLLPGDGSALLGMSDVEFLGILKIMHEVVDDKQVHRKFNSKTMEAATALCYRTNTDIDSRSDSVDVIKSNSNMYGYFRSRTNREVDTNQASYQHKMYTANLVMHSQEWGVLGHIQI